MAKGGGLPKEPTAFIEKMVGKETKREKKKKQKKAENDIVKRLTRNVLIDEKDWDKASGITKKKSSKKKKKKKKGSSSSSDPRLTLRLIPALAIAPINIPRAILKVPQATTT